MNIPDDVDMGEMGMDRAGIKKGVKWKLNNDIDPGCPQECDGDYDNTRGGGGAEDGSDGHVSKICIDTSNIVILH